MSAHLLYAASAPVWMRPNSFLVKLGLTTNPRARMETYLTGCPPRQTPSAELEYLKLWSTTATTGTELRAFETLLHNQFQSHRMTRLHGDLTEWFEFDDDPIPLISDYLSKQPWIVGEVQYHNLFQE